MDWLNRETAPISERMWKEVDDAVVRIARHTLAARRVADFDGPRGWNFVGVRQGTFRPPPALEISSAQLALPDVTKPPWQRALVLGAVAGMRTFLAPAMLSADLHQRAAHDSDTTSSWLASRSASRILGLLSAGELLADKLPVMPSRLDPAPLLARGISGAVVGSAVFEGGRGSRLAGAILGMGAALGTAFGAYHIRQWVGRNLHLPDALVAAGEDALAVSAALSVLPVNVHGDEATGLAMRVPYSMG